MTDAFLARADGLWNSAEDLARGDGAAPARADGPMAVDYDARARAWGSARWKGIRTRGGAADARGVGRTDCAVLRGSGSERLTQIREHGDTVAEYRAGWER